MSVRFNNLRVELGWFLSLAPLRLVTGVDPGCGDNHVIWGSSYIRIKFSSRSRASEGATPNKVPWMSSFCCFTVTCFCLRNKAHTWVTRLESFTYCRAVRSRPVFCWGVDNYSAAFSQWPRWCPEHLSGLELPQIAVRHGQFPWCHGNCVASPGFSAPLSALPLPCSSFFLGLLSCHSALPHYFLFFMIS